MKVAYTIGARLGDGIGLTAQKGIDGLRAAGVLGPVVNLDQDALHFGGLGDVGFDNLAAADLGFQGTEVWDTIVAWNHMALAQLTVAKDRNAGSVVIRASTHPRHQQRILNEEVARLGFGPSVPNSVVERCEKEFELADLILIPSEVVRKTMVEHGVPESKLLKVPHGVDLQQFAPPPEGWRTETFKAIFVGANWVRKGLFYLLKAWESVPHGWLDVAPLDRLPMAGFNYTENNPVWPTGHIPDLAKHFKDFHVLVLPTLEEGQALVCLEAAAAGMAVVTTEESGALEALEKDKSCLIVPPRDPKAIADALNYLREDPQACRMMGLAARAAVEKWPWERYGKGVVAACEAANRA